MSKMELEIKAGGNCSVGRGGVYVYEGIGYKFKLTADVNPTHTSHLMKPSHIKILNNSTSLTPSSLREQIVSLWFSDENDDVRLHRNEVARVRRAKISANLKKKTRKKE